MVSHISIILPQSGPSKYSLVAASTCSWTADGGIEKKLAKDDISAFGVGQYK